MAEVIITSLSEFHEEIKNIKSGYNGEYEYLYRGQEDVNWDLLPCVFRVNNEKSYRLQETLLYQEMWRRNPEHFKDCSSIFERLAKMQHHGLPTRLLDITFSPLVALFFATQNLPSSDGGVFVFKVKKDDVYFYNQLPEHLLSDFESEDNVRVFRCIIKCLHDNIVLSRKELNDSLFDMVKNHKIYPSLIRNDFQKICRYVKNTYRQRNSSPGRKLSISLYRKICFVLRVIDKKISVLESLAGKYSDYVLRDFAYRCRMKMIEINDKILLLLNDILVKLEYSDLLELLKSYSQLKIVYPPLNNERIKRQQGAFMCYPGYEFTRGYIANQIKFEVIKIDKSKKEYIQNELKDAGVTRAYLFPDFDEQAKDISLNLYPPI